jgi:hypothetical protein
MQLLLSRAGSLPYEQPLNSPLERGLIWVGEGLNINILLTWFEYIYESLLVEARKEFDKFVLLGNINVYISLSTQLKGKYRQWCRPKPQIWIYYPYMFIFLILKNRLDSDQYTIGNKLGLDLLWISSNKDFLPSILKTICDEYEKSPDGRKLIPVKVYIYIWYQQHDITTTISLNSFRLSSGLLFDTGVFIIFFSHMYMLTNAQW